MCILFKIDSRDILKTVDILYVRATFPTREMFWLCVREKTQIIMNLTLISCFW